MVMSCECVWPMDSYGRLAGGIAIAICIPMAGGIAIAICIAMAGGIAIAICIIAMAVGTTMAGV